MSFFDTLLFTLDVNDVSIILSAIEEKDIHLVSWTLRNISTRTMAIVDKAVDVGDAEILRMCLNNGCCYNISIYVKALKTNRIEIISLFFKETCGIVEYLLENEPLDVVESLMNNNELSYTSLSFIPAITNKDKCKWCILNGYIDIEDAFIVDMVLLKNNPEVIALFNKSKEYNRLRALFSHLERKEKCISYHDSLFESAIMTCDKKAITECVSYGCHWPLDILNKVIFKCTPRQLSFLLSVGCPVRETTYFCVVKRGDVDILDVLVEANIPKIKGVVHCAIVTGKMEMLKALIKYDFPM